MAYTTAEVVGMLDGSDDDLEMDLQECDNPYGSDDDLGMDVIGD